MSKRAKTPSPLRPTYQHNTTYFADSARVVFSPAHDYVFRERRILLILGRTCHLTPSLQEVFAIRSSLAFPSPVPSKLDGSHEPVVLSGFREITLYSTAITYGLPNCLPFLERVMHSSVRQKCSSFDFHRSVPNELSREATRAPSQK